ncbi:MAG: hypothetical protein MK183_13440 [Verrucomicrobiales bacterium]|nr:hypothetical protein [Verrucomicrobiales bacterium]
MHLSPYSDDELEYADNRKANNKGINSPNEYPQIDDEVVMENGPEEKKQDAGYRQDKKVHVF